MDTTEEVYFFDTMDEAIEVMETMRAERACELGSTKRMTDKHVQRKMILDHMTRIGPITRAEAMNIYGIGNITARLTELRREGYKIQTIMTQGVNRYGKHINYARWMLMEG